MRRLSGDKVINQNSKALERKQKSAYQSIGPSRDIKEKSLTEPRFPPAPILYIRWCKKSASTLIVVRDSIKHFEV